jgi:hypothetical protein
MNDLAKNHPGVLALLFLFVLFPALGCYASWSFARIGGWARIAKDYASRSVPQGPVFSMMSLQISSFGGYNNCIKVIFCAEGIYMVPFLIFRPGHAPLLIPWSKVGPEQTRSFLGMQYTFFPIEASGKKLKLRLKPPALAWLKQNPNYRDFALQMTRVP